MQVFPPKPSRHWHCPVNCTTEWKNRHDTSISFVSVNVNESCERIYCTMRCASLKMFRSKCSIPHYMRRWLSCWDHSHRVHSPSRWPGSSGWGRSGHMSDLWHLVGTGTALWHAGTHSPHAPYTGCVQFPGSYMCTLKENRQKECRNYDIVFF